MPETRLDRLPRMADFALWVTACEPAIWPAGTFGAAYTGNRDEAVDRVIEANPVGSAIRSMMNARTVWTGTASALLGALEEGVGEKVRKSKSWPSSANALSGQVRRVATFLRKVGIDITFEREGRARTRIIQIARKLKDAPTRSSAPSAPSAQLPKAAQNKGLGDADARTVASLTDANPGPLSPGTVRSNQPQNNDLTAADGVDANSLTYSDDWKTRL